MSAGYDGCWQVDESKQRNGKMFVSMLGTDLHTLIGRFLSKLLESRMGVGGKWGEGVTGAAGEGNK